VVIFAYARVDHLRKMVASLLANPEASDTDVTFYCDAPKRAAHQSQVDSVREYVANVTGFRSIRRVFRERNFGLARSVIDGVGEALRDHGRVIVLEDDLLLSPHFLAYMNAGLTRYEHDDRVASIHGYCYPVDRPLPETFFLQGADCWGWATWSRAWERLRQDGSSLLRDLKQRRLVKDFDFDWQYPFTGMLADQIAGRNSSWAILWHATCYLDGLLTLYPGRSLVENIGNDATGTHNAATNAYSRAVTLQPVKVTAIPVENCAEARQAFADFFRKHWTPRTRLRSALNRLIRGYA
jgi:hypothetical protein